MASLNKGSHSSNGFNRGNSMNYPKKIWIITTSLNCWMRQLGTIKVISTCRSQLISHCQCRMQGLLSKYWKEECEARAGTIRAISEKKRNIKTIRLHLLIITTIPFRANHLLVIWCKSVIRRHKGSLAHSSSSSLPCNSFTRRTFMIFL